jgi:hypothetical protein
MFLRKDLTMTHLEVQKLYLERQKLALEKKKLESDEVYKLHEREVRHWYALQGARFAVLSICLSTEVFLLGQTHFYLLKIAANKVPKINLLIAYVLPFSGMLVSYSALFAEKVLERMLRRTIAEGMRLESKIGQVSGIFSDASLGVLERSLHHPQMTHVTVFCLTGSVYLWYIITLVVFYNVWTV